LLKVNAHVLYYANYKPSFNEMIFIKVNKKQRLIILKTAENQQLLLKISSFLEQIYSLSNECFSSIANPQVNRPERVFKPAN